MSVEDLTAVGEQLKHLQLGAVGGYHDVAVPFTQKLHVQHFIVVSHKLGESGQREQQKRARVSINCSVLNINKRSRE